MASSSVQQLLFLLLLLSAAEASFSSHQNPLSPHAPQPGCRQCHYTLLLLLHWSLRSNSHYIFEHVGTCAHCTYTHTHTQKRRGSSFLPYFPRSETICSVMHALPGCVYERTVHIRKCTQLCVFLFSLQLFLRPQRSHGEGERERGQQRAIWRPSGTPLLSLSPRYCTTQLAPSIPGGGTKRERGKCVSRNGDMQRRRLLLLLCCICKLPFPHRYCCCC